MFCSSPYIKAAAENYVKLSLFIICLFIQQTTNIYYVPDTISTTEGGVSKTDTGPVPMGLTF